MNEDKIIFSLEGHNSKYGVCEHKCQNGSWTEIKNCCCGHEGDNDWYNCGGASGFPTCEKNNEGLVVYTSCYPT